LSRKQRSPAWTPPDYEVAHIRAVKAVAKGEATAAEQKLAMDWIIEAASARWDVPFYSDKDGGDRETAFACGRIFVGQQIIKLVNMPAGLVAQMAKKKGNPNG